MNTDAALEAEFAFRVLIFTRPCRGRGKKYHLFQVRTDPIWGCLLQESDRNSLYLLTYNVCMAVL